MTLEVFPDLIHRQIMLVGHWTFSKVDQADCARFVSDRKIDVDSLFTHKWALEQAEEAYELFYQQKMGKGVFLPSYITPRFLSSLSFTPSISRRLLYISVL